MVYQLKQVNDFGDLNRELREIFDNFPQLTTDANSNMGLVGVSGTPFNPKYTTGVPIGKAPSGSVGANGALTLTAGNDLPNIYGPTGVGPGIWLWFPAGACYAASPSGAYWCVMTSVTVGTIYNITHAFPGIVGLPTSTPAIVDAGPGAYSGIITEVTLLDVTVPANTMGTKGAYRQTIYWSQTNVAGTTVYSYFGGVLGYSGTVSANTGGASQTMVSNRGSASYQGRPTGLTSFNSTKFAGYTIDTTQDQRVKVTAATAAATVGHNHHVIMESATVEVFFS